MIFWTLMGLVLFVVAIVLVVDMAQRPDRWH